MSILFDRDPRDNPEPYAEDNRLRIIETQNVILNRHVKRLMKAVNHIKQDLEDQLLDCKSRGTRQTLEGQIKILKDALWEE